MTSYKIKDRIKPYFDRFWKITLNYPCDIIIHKSERPFKNLRPVFADALINASYHNDNQKLTHEEFVKCFNGNFIIEPDYAICICDFRLVLRESIFYPSVKPSVIRYLQSYFKPRKFLEKAIIFDGTVGLNYFHFFLDVFHKIWLLKYIPGYATIPIIVNEKIFNRPYFKFLMNLPEINSLSWFVQKSDEYLRIKHLYLLSPMPYEKKYIKQTRELLRIESPIPIKNVFLARSPQAGRFITNMAEIENILYKYNFEIVDTAGMGFIEQLRLFSKVKHLIGIHGAGLTNIIFANKMIRVLELMPEDRIACQYYWLANALEIEYYDVIAGSPLSSGYKNNGFSILPNKLESAIKELVVS